MGYSEDGDEGWEEGRGHAGPLSHTHTHLILPCLILKRHWFACLSCTVSNKPWHEPGRWRRCSSSYTGLPDDGAPHYWTTTSLSLSFSRLPRRGRASIRAVGTHRTPTTPPPPPQGTVINETSTLHPGGLAEHISPTKPRHVTTHSPPIDAIANPADTLACPSASPSSHAFPAACHPTNPFRPRRRPPFLPPTAQHSTAREPQ
ncbi:hypothetical protein LZ30DRAFT_292555 [Colletotrichum cereale]|nr:hypothetical protein LZ30DRAFT_292555 [Colletotrichum cereale]